MHEMWAIDVSENRCFCYLFGTMTYVLLGGCAFHASEEVHLPYEIEIIAALRTQLCLLDLGDSIISKEYTISS